MPITANVNFEVPDLPDADVWFANASAWNNYWDTIPATVTINPIATTLYVPAPFNQGLQATAINIDGVDYVLVNQAMFTSLLNQVNALDISYQTLRTVLRNAGLITNAQ